MAAIVSLMTVGPELSRDELWLTTMIEFLDDLFAGGWELKNYTLSVRPIVARGFVPGIRRVWKHQANARRFLVPIMQRRRAAEAAAKVSGRTYSKPNDLLQWLMDNAARANPPRTDANVAELCLVVGFGALHASTITLANVVFDLAAMPEYVDPIRAEWDDAVKSQGGNQAATINSLGKLDSFMKESQRLNPVALSEYCVLLPSLWSIESNCISPFSDILPPSAQTHRSLNRPHSPCRNAHSCPCGHDVQ